jgi:hypothetical protein
VAISNIPYFTRCSESKAQLISNFRIDADIFVNDPVLRPIKKQVSIVWQIPSATQT